MIISGSKFLYPRQQRKKTLRQAFLLRWIGNGCHRGVSSSLSGRCVARCDVIMGNKGPGDHTSCRTCRTSSSSSRALLQAVFRIAGLPGGLPGALPGALPGGQSAEVSEGRSGTNPKDRGGDFGFRSRRLRRFRMPVEANLGGLNREERTEALMP